MLGNASEVQNVQALLPVTKSLVVVNGKYSTVRIVIYIYILITKLKVDRTLKHSLINPSSLI